MICQPKKMDFSTKEQIGMLSSQLKMVKTSSEGENAHAFPLKECICQSASFYLLQTPQSD